MQADVDESFVTPEFKAGKFLAAVYGRKAWIGEVVQSSPTHVVITFMKNCRLIKVELALHT